MSTLRRGCAAALLACTLGQTPGADTLCLADGRIFDGVELQRTAEGVVIHFENGVVTVPSEQIYACIIPGDPGYEPGTDAERQKIADGFVFYDGKWIKPQQRDRALKKLIEEQAALVEELKSTRLWRNRRMEETKNFTFEYTVPQHVFESYRDLMETYYKEFAKTFKIKPPRGHEPLKVCFYVDYDAFLQVTGVQRGIQGFFKFVRPYELAIYYNRLDPRYTEEVIYHEVGHYLQKLIDVDFKYPHWPGEAISEYYGASRWDPEKKRLDTGLILEGRLGQIKLDIKNGEYVTVRELLLGAEASTFHDYSWGWSFAHFLMNDKRYRKKFPKFIVSLARGQGIDRYPFAIARDNLKTLTGEEMYEVFNKQMGLRSEEDLDELQKEWYAYIENDLQITSTRGLQTSAWQAFGFGRPQRAKRLFEEAAAAGGLTAVGHHRLATVLEKLDEDEEARANWRKAVELDPLVADYYIELGRSLLDDEDSREEGKRLLRLAHEIEPDNFYLERNLQRLLNQ